MDDAVPRLLRPRVALQLEKGGWNVVGEVLIGWSGWFSYSLAVLGDWGTAPGGACSRSTSVDGTLSNGSCELTIKGWKSDWDGITEGYGRSRGLLSSKRLQKLGML